MEEKLDFSLPEMKNKNPISKSISLITLLVLLNIALTAWLLFTINKIAPNRMIQGLSALETEQLAQKLASRNLHLRSARTWQDYASTLDYYSGKRANVYFQIAGLLEKSGIYDQAIEYYYRCELAGGKPELEDQINSHIKSCFEKLGKFSALRYELMDRTSFDKSSSAGSKIVAEIGAEKITEADLDALIEAAIDNQLAPMATFMTSEQLNEQKKKMLQQYKDPAAKQQFLQSWLMQEIMYRQALEDDLVREPKVKSFIDELTRSALSQQLMNRQLAGKINITETDLQTYYQANMQRFIEPADKQDPNSVERQKSFEEVRDQITSELVNRKSQDIQQSLIKQLMDKYNVIVHTSVFTPAGKTENDK